MCGFFRRRGRIQIFLAPARDRMANSTSRGVAAKPLFHIQLDFIDFEQGPEGNMKKDRDLEHKCGL